MPDELDVNAQGLQTDLSLPGDPTTQVAVPNPDNILTVNADWDQTANTISFNGNKYSLTLVGPIGG